MKLPTSPVGYVLYALAAVAITGLAYVVVYRMFFQGQDLAQLDVNKIVAEEQVKAEEQIVSHTLNTIQDRVIFHERMAAIADESNKEVTHAWNGETVGDAVDRSGSAALCRLHHNLCRPAPAESVQ